MKEVLEALKQGKPIAGGSDAHRAMHRLAQDALRFTAQLNGSYHEPEEIRKLFSELIGKPVDDSFGILPGFMQLFVPLQRHVWKVERSFQPYVFGTVPTWE